MTIDHFLSLELGGTNELSNLVPSCRSCNLSKGPKSIEEFRFAVEMKKFKALTGVSFTRVQVGYLESIGTHLEVKRYQFWFEAHMGHDNKNVTSGASQGR